jgi:hypothetical protein
MVLSTHIALDAFSILTSSAVDIFTCLISSNERDCSNVGVSTDVGNSVSSTLHDIYDSIRDSGLLQKVQKNILGTWDLLGRLHDIGVSKSDSEGEHPERAHGWEVEWGDSGANTERHSVRVEIDSLSNVTEGLTLVQGGKAASMLNDFEASENISLSVDEGLSVLLGDHLSDFILNKR